MLVLLSLALADEDADGLAWVLRLFEFPWKYIFATKVCIVIVRAAPSHVK